MSTIKASVQAPKIADYVRGDSRLFNITVLKGDAKTPFDLTGCEVWLTVNANSNNITDGDVSAVISLKNNSITNPQTGVAQIYLSNADTQDITPGVYYYDIQLKDANGNITSLAQNEFIIIPDVTRSIV